MPKSILSQESTSIFDSPALIIIEPKDVELKITYICAFAARLRWEILYVFRM